MKLGILDYILLDDRYGEEDLGVLIVPAVFVVRDMAETRYRCVSSSR